MGDAKANDIKKYFKKFNDIVGKAAVCIVWLGLASICYWTSQKSNDLSDVPAVFISELGLHLHTAANHLDAVGSFFY